MQIFFRKDPNSKSGLQALEQLDNRALKAGPFDVVIKEEEKESLCSLGGLDIEIISLLGS